MVRIERSASPCPAPSSFACSAYRPCGKDAKFGPHIHFINFLVRPNASLQTILTELNTNRPKLKSAIHIRYKELTIGDLKDEAQDEPERLTQRAE